MIAEVIINSNVKTLNRIFDYSIPDYLLEKVKIGSRVFVPFGRGKKTEEGFVIGIKEKSEYPVKDILNITEGFLLTKENIELATHMSKRYFCNISDCIKLMLPPGTATRSFENRAKEKYIKAVYISEDIEELDEPKSDKQKRVLNVLRDNEGIILQDLEMIAETSVAIIKTLEKNGYLQIVEKQAERNPFEHKDVQPTTKLSLTEEQQHAFNEINKSMQDNKFAEFLLYGVTGSRKN